MLGQGLACARREDPGLPADKMHLPHAWYLSMTSAHHSPHGNQMPSSSSGFFLDHTGPPKATELHLTVDHPGATQCFYGYGIAVPSQASSSFCPAGPLKQEQGDRSMCDSITNLEKPCPPQSSLLPTQRLRSLSGPSEGSLEVGHISKASGLICKWCQANLSDPDPKYSKRLLQEGEGDLEHRHHYLFSSLVILPACLLQGFFH